ncbi:acetate/propionate family kinase [Thermanaeromonas toyohensis]|uniref:acetate/propionate family kinase n=1 Tax=Thermanaeromonas toyohensis TaxID=161154 RepID=UPI0009FE240F|nr:acetate kinase [Thermanaeromonas toyohensis]
MKILVLNCGSSSVKYQLFDMAEEKSLAKGLVERIGLPGSRLTHRPVGKEKIVKEVPVPDHGAAIKLSLEALTHPQHGVIKEYSEIRGIGHRVVHGGSFSASVLIDSQTKDLIAELEALAPLHNGPALRGITACEVILPHTPQVACFDTAFHQTMPDYVYTYALPYELTQKYQIRRYGFHGTSHKYVAQRAAELVGRPWGDLKIITCHLGNGSSITAIKNGKSYDTSMGFTPLPGLVMGTRCGDIDPAIVTFLMEKEGWTTKEVEEVLNRRSGVLGVSGLSSDFRDIEEAMEVQNERARLAWDMFVYSVRKYIGAYIVALGGLDVLVFTAGLGENSPRVRLDICQGLDFLGIQIDQDKNNVRGEEREITAPGAQVRTFVIPTNEELMIAKDTQAVLQEKGLM